MENLNYEMISMYIGVVLTAMVICFFVMVHSVVKIKKMLEKGAESKTEDADSE